MGIPKIFEICQPRADVLAGNMAESDFAADLAQVVSGEGNAEYKDPVRFFANTYPTRGLKNLLTNVCGRLSGTGEEAAAIFRLDTSYGGGKTHGLIALAHAARGMEGVSDVAEFVDPSLLPEGAVRVAVFDGENADPLNGRDMGEGILAHTPWGEIAHSLAGKEGYERIRNSDEAGVAPGSETIRELFGGQPTLILLDELSVYLRKVNKLPDARDQLTAFLTSLFKAVEVSPKAALVYTLAIGKDGRATDAYSAENQHISDTMAEAESVSARKATLLNPTEEDETVQVLRRRLFGSIDDNRALEALNAYREIWLAHREHIAEEAARPETMETFRSSYPFHPDVLETLTGKTATLGNFQRVRGMLRLLARTIAHLWEMRPSDATAIHVHHIDPGYQPIQQEIVTRLGQSNYVPAISNDVSAGADNKKSLAEEIDAEHYRGLPPYTAYAARTIFLHTLAFNDSLKGLMPEQLRYSMLGPNTDFSFVEEARKKFIADSAYLDDRPGAPMRFLVEANLTQIIRREEQHVDAGEARAELNDRIREIFRGSTFDAVCFPGGPFDVADEVGDGRPKLAVLAYDGVTAGGAVDEVPELVERIFTRKGSEGSKLRVLRNHIVFAVADDALKDEMRRKASQRLALRELKKPERLKELAEHQQAQVREREARSQHDLAITIQQCYRHVFYPSRSNIGTKGVDLAHTVIEMQSTSDQPGAGQRQIERALRELNKLRLPEDEPDSPAYIRDRTPLRGGEVSTWKLREEFRRDPALPILVADDLLIRAIRRGVEQEEYVYQRGDLLYGPGDPLATIMVDEQSFVFTMRQAKANGIWPRPEKIPERATPAAKGGGEGGGEEPPKPDPDGQPPPPSPPQPRSFSKEAVLKDALTQLWEVVRSSKIERIGRLTIRMFEAGDAFRLLGAVGAVKGAEKRVEINGGYETGDGGELQLTFNGPVADAQPIREFLDPQIRAAAEQTLEISFQLDFAEGLATEGDGPEKLTAALTRFASGAAFVKATAEVQGG